MNTAIKEQSHIDNINLTLDELLKYDSTFTEASIEKHSVKLNKLNNSKRKLEEYFKNGILENVIDNEFNTPQIRETLYNHMQYMFYANMYKSKEVRTALQNWPTNEQYAEYKTMQILDKHYSYVPENLKNELAKYYDSPYDFDGISTIPPSYLPIFIDVLDLNINYFEMLVYSYMKDLFSGVQKEYWQNYIRLFTFLHKNFKDEFSLSVQFRSNLEFDELKQLKTQILRYQKRIDKNHKSPLFKEYMDVFDINF